MEYLNIFSQESWPIIALVVIVALWVIRSKKINTSPMVVRSLFVSSTPRADGVYVEIVARESGVMGWLLAKLKMDPNLEMRVKYSKVEYMSSSLFGFDRVVLPIESVSSVYFGATRPWKQALSVLLTFFLGAFFAADAAYTVWVIVLVLAGFGAALFTLMFNRQRTIGFTEATGENYEVTLARSVIEGQEIDAKKLEEISTIIMAIIDDYKQPKGAE